MGRIRAGEGCDVLFYAPGRMKEAGNKGSAELRETLKKALKQSLSDFHGILRASNMLKSAFTAIELSGSPQTGFP